MIKIKQIKKEMEALYVMDHLMRTCINIHIKNINNPDADEDSKAMSQRKLNKVIPARMMMLEYYDKYKEAVAVLGIKLKYPKIRKEEKAVFQSYSMIEREARLLLKEIHDPATTKRQRKVDYSKLDDCINAMRVMEEFKTQYDLYTESIRKAVD